MLIEKVNNGTYSQCRIPGLVITEKGTLVAYYECRKTNSDWADIDIKVIRSTDCGESWQTVKVISGDGNTMNNPVMFVNNGSLHFLFFKNYKEMFHSVSTDDGKTFSEPQRKNIECGFFYSVVAAGPGHGIVHNGKMIVPVWFAQNREDPKAHHPSVIATIFSADGESWQLGETVGTDILTNPSECTLAVTPENRVLISIRNENPCHQRAFALSDTGIGGWQDLHFDPRFPDPICMGSMCCENGRICHINCQSTNVRENLTLKISDDCFKSFESVFVDTPAGYADIAIQNGRVYILYERDCTLGGLYFKKIDL